MTVQKMNSTWDDLRFFLAVYRERSLRRAARALAVNHGTVLRRIERLERDLGTRLFDRTRGGFLPTQPAEELARYALRMEEEYAAVCADVAGRDGSLAGPVNVSVPFALFHAVLADFFVAFGERCPGIALNVEVTDEFSRFVNLDADVAVRMAFQVDDHAVGRRLFQYTKAVFAAPATCARLAAGADDVAWLGWNDPAVGQGWVAGTEFADLPVRHDFPGHQMQLDMALRGPFVVMLPVFLGDSVAGLQRVAGALPIPDRSVWLLYRVALRQTARVRVLADALVEWLHSRRALFQCA